MTIDKAKIPNLVNALVNGLDIDDAEDLLEVLQSDDDSLLTAVVEGLDAAIDRLAEEPTDG